VNHRASPNSSDEEIVALKADPSGLKELKCRKGYNGGNPEYFVPKSLFRAFFIIHPSSFILLAPY